MLKEKANKKENAQRYFLCAFSHYDGEYDVTFNIVDVDFYCQTITVAITRCGKITQDTFNLLRDSKGNLYFEYGMFDENKISLNDFTEVN